MSAIPYTCDRIKLPFQSLSGGRCPQWYLLQGLEKYGTSAKQSNIQK